jgi:phage terminase large subunit GpA-like protein
MAVRVSQKTIEVAASVLAGFAPPPELLPSEWAERSVYIPVGNAIPGLIRFDNAPYQREPLNMTANPACQRITLQWSGQVGKTMVGLCAQAYKIEQDPSSQIMMQPSQGDLQTWLETKFNPLIDANKSLHALVAKARGRDGVNNQRMKSYPGGFIMFSWSGSPKSMRGRSAPFIVCDETDGYDRTHEGHPVNLLWQRAATFMDQRKLLEISTPGIKGVSWIEGQFEAGDQRRFYVVCAHCDVAQHLKWSSVKWDRDEDGRHMPETAGYVCEGCGVVWSDNERVAAIRAAEKNGGGWQAEKPFRGHASYHLNEMYSCFRRLGDIVQSFLEKKAAGDLQSFVNLSLAETWEEEGDQVEAAPLMARARAFAAQVPQGAAVLTAGVDMQRDRLEVEVVGWGLGEESWSVDYRVLWGDPLLPDVWADLDALLSETFLHQSGAQLPIAAACLDTGGDGGLTSSAYDYARGKLGRRIFAIKGVGGWGRPVVSAPAKKRQRKARPVSLFTVGVDEAKLIVMRRLDIQEPGPGYCHVPDTRVPEWFSQVTAEKLRTRLVKGFQVREWFKTRERNEAFDCRVYAFAALKILNPNIKRLVDRLVPEPDDDVAPVVPQQAASAPPPKKGKPPEDAGAKAGEGTAKRRRRSARKRGAGWINSW